MFYKKADFPTNTVNHCYATCQKQITILCLYLKRNSTKENGKGVATILNSPPQPYSVAIPFSIVISMYLSVMFDRSGSCCGYFYS